MTQDSHCSDGVFKLSPRIDLLPIRHGSGDMAQEVREAILARKIDCLAVALPPSVETPLEQAIDQLPLINVVVIPEPSQEGPPVHTYVPVDPCQPVIMGIRVAVGEGIPRNYIDREVTVYEPSSYLSPDPYALKRVSLAVYAASLLPFVKAPSPGSQREERIAWMAFRLHELELDYTSILCLCLVEDWSWLRLAYQDRLPYKNPELLEGRPSLFRASPSSLYFILGELPFLTELYERRRKDARADTHLSIDGIKELVLEARSRWLTARQSDSIQESHWVTPQLLQVYLQYVRNLALIERRFTPDLFTLVLAAKQMAGDEFALELLETAKRYAFQETDDSLHHIPELEIGLGHMEFPDGEVAKGKNRLQGEPLHWRSLSLRPTPSQPKKRAWAYRWNPFRQCSWPPEDNRIEAFTAHVRHQARSLLGTDLGKVEKFTSSLRDGLDLRETLRHWPTASRASPLNLYVKDIPPARGHVEVIVFLFDVPANPDTYAWRATWYAEHEEESTLCFYATPFPDTMVGPGIAQSRYGGALFLFPPRPIPDIWTDPRFAFTHTLEERILAAACAHSSESYVALVSPIPVKIQWRRIARRYQRRLIPIPLSRFSGQTIDRLRRFHVLNGHEIRSYADQFIRR